MRGPLLTLLVIQLLCTGSAYGKAEYPQVTVDDPYIEMHTGPGKGYPIFHVVDRGDSIEVIKRRTDWFLIRTVAGKEGWASRAQMELTLQPSGERTEIKDTTLAEFHGRRWEMGIMGGDFSGATSFSMFGAYRMSANLSAELAVTQLLGNFSDGWMVNVNLVHLFFPEWRASPFFLLGTGIVRVEPKATLVQTTDRTDPVGTVGLGIRTYLTDRFVFRLEYNGHVVFSSRDDNEDVDEWKLGFSVFF